MGDDRISRSSLATVEEYDSSTAPDLELRAYRTGHRNTLKSKGLSCFMSSTGWAAKGAN